MEFDAPRYIQLLWAVAAGGLLIVYAAWRRRAALRAFASANLLSRLAPGVSVWRVALKTALWCGAISALTIALAGPRWGEREQQVFRRGIDVFVLLDVSKSMLARDIAPNRLERAKISLRDDLLPELGGDRIGLITFAGVPVLKCPLTNDYGFFRLVLDEVNTDSVPRGGSLIGDAIRSLKDKINDKLDTHRVVLLITDGDDHLSYPIEAARELWDTLKIPVIAVALGDDSEGARVPVKTDRGETYLEYQGETVVSKADFATLRRVAEASDPSGQGFIAVGTKNFDLGQVYRSRIAPFFKQKERLDTEKVERPSQGHWFAMAALALLAAETLLRDTTQPPPRDMAVANGDASRRSAA
ncbi:MAG: VWA domain-containing protein [Phycisphaerales bacterium]|nr:VWA domain-containing protein [Phycisphaerales bacterium]